MKTGFNMMTGMTLAILFIANVLIVLADLSWLKLSAGISLIFILSGLAWLQATHWFGTRDGLTRIWLVGGFSTALSGLALYFAVYWPGPFQWLQVLFALNLVTLIGLVVAGLRSETEAQKLCWPDKTVLALLTFILLIAAFLRFYNLSYAEFHEDEVENVAFASRAIAGVEYILFVDNKGPIHWLLPSALWLINGWLNEAIARFTFAFSSLWIVLGVYVLGACLFNPKVGLLAAGLSTLNGFFVAYARQTEHPTLHIVWALILAWLAYEYYRHQQSSLLIFGGFLSGVALITHPETILYATSFALCVFYTFWQHKSLLQKHWLHLSLGILLAVCLAASFYIPYLQDPSLQHSKEFLIEERLGQSGLYNAVPDWLMDFDTNYSTRFHWPVLFLFTGVALWTAFRQLGRWAKGLFGLLALTILTTPFLTDWWDWSTLINGAFLPYALVFLIPIFSPLTQVETKILLIWFGIPLMIMTFLTREAADHIMIAYPFWQILVAWGCYCFWQMLSNRQGQIISWATVIILILWAGLILSYQYIQFLGRTTDYWRIEAQAKSEGSSLFRTLYGDVPKPRELFSNPRLGGWKVVGYLYHIGVLQGDFRSIDESFAVPIWYTHQTPRSCYTDPQNYFFRVRDRPNQKTQEALFQQGYGLTRVVFVDDQPMLKLFEKGLPSAAEPEIYDVDDYRRLFDRTATPENYASNHQAQYALSMNFGDKLHFLGYDLPKITYRPGETVLLTLYWQALQPMDIRYRAFVHIGEDPIWGQHDEDPVCRLRTDEWRVGDLGQRQFRATLALETPPGSLPIRIGVYNPDTWERLEVFDEQGQSQGNFIELTMIGVE